MKNAKKMIMGLAVMGVLSAGVVFAQGQDHGKMMKDKTVMEVKSKKAVEVGNKICPVTGNPVDDGKMGEAVKYEYKGKMYNLCCKMCVKDFKKNPEKYSKIAEDEVKKLSDQKKK